MKEIENIIREKIRLDVTIKFFQTIPISDNVFNHILPENILRKNVQRLG